MARMILIPNMNRKINMSNEYTYSDMAKPICRERMAKCGVSKLGTQSGGFGKFQGHFTVLSEQALANVRSDAIAYCSSNNISKEQFLDIFPSLKSIV